MLKHIALGTDFVDYYNYDGNALPIRPLSTYELDEALKKSVGGISPLIFNEFVKFKLNLIEDSEIKITKHNYESFLDFHNEFDHWIVYYSIKDFQDSDFSKPDYEGEYKKYDDWNADFPKGYYKVREMKYVHKIAEKIMSMTNQPETKLMKILENDEGQILATFVHYFHVPLADKAWKLTPLQQKYIIFSRPGAPEYVEDVEKIPGIKGGTMEEIAKQLKDMGL